MHLSVPWVLIYSPHAYSWRRVGVWPLSSMAAQFHGFHGLFCSPAPVLRVKMADGSSAGLVRADQLAEEARRKRAAEDAKWAKLGMRRGGG
jgi:hypothetical protein